MEVLYSFRPLRVPHFEAKKNPGLVELPRVQVDKVMMYLRAVKELIP